jgi:hypothetical protein
MRKIPIHCGPRIVDFCDDSSVHRYEHAPNAEVVRKHKTGQVVRINVLSFDDMSGKRSVHLDSRQPGYEEHLEETMLPMLKRVHRETQALIPWSDRVSFNPRRFNPDRLAAKTGGGRPVCPPLARCAA